MAKPNRLQSRVIGILTALLLQAGLSLPAFAQEVHRFDITATDPAAAIHEFGSQAGVQILASAEGLRGKRLNEISGELSTDEGLRRLLAGSGMTHRYVGDRTVALVAENQTAAAEKPAGTRDEPPSSSPIPATPTSGAPATSSTAAERTTQRSAQRTETEQVELFEIVVTGSYIRGAPSASPIHSYDRRYIESTGVGTLQEFVRQLPLNFNGGPSETNTSFSPENNAGLNVDRGTGVNLRAQGTDATLVLLNGRRLSVAGLGQFVDISLIPISAIERVEFLTDGASAIYGSDAVGGVANFILRDEYEGAETRVRYGTVTTGDSDEKQFGQTVGGGWDSGSVLGSYEYYERSPLDSSDRHFTADVVDPTYLLPEQKRSSVFLTGRQALADRSDLFGTAFYTERRHEMFVGSNFSATTFHSQGETEEYGAILGTRIETGASWRTELAGTFSRADTASTSRNFAVPLDPANPGTPAGRSATESKALAVDLKADGVLFTLPGGGAKAAIGAQYRRENYASTGSADPRFNTDSERGVRAAFGEIFMPLFGDENRRPGIRRLELTLAGRYERYSDFGPTTNPKAGVFWSPGAGFNLRGTYGTSFRAPQLRELSEINVQGILVNAPDASSPTGSTLTLVGFGNNADLGAEEATTWTAGLDLAPPAVPALKVSLTYFDISFDDKIESVLTLFEVFTDPRYASLITRDPDPELIAFFTSRPLPIINLTASAPEGAQAFFDGRLRNFASVDTSGLELSASYGLETSIASWTFLLDGTYLFEQIEQVLPADLPVDVVNTVYHPVDLRLRGGIGWSRGGFGGSLFVNYVGDYADDRVDPALEIGSWTTLDLQLGYRFQARDVETSVSLSALNLLDRDPPFVVGAFGNSINFDPDNASALGRWLALQLTVAW